MKGKVCQVRGSVLVSLAPSVGSVVTLVPPQVRRQVGSGEVTAGGERKGVDARSVVDGREVPFSPVGVVQDLHLQIHRLHGTPVGVKQR